jgi:hypothetical protein
MHSGACVMSGGAYFMDSGAYFMNGGAYFMNSGAYFMDSGLIRTFCDGRCGIAIVCRPLIATGGAASLLYVALSGLGQK